MEMECRGQFFVFSFFIFVFIGTFLRFGETPNRSAVQGQAQGHVPTGVQGGHLTSPVSPLTAFRLSVSRLPSHLLPPSAYDPQPPHTSQIVR